MFGQMMRKEFEQREAALEAIHLNERHRDVEVGAWDRSPVSRARRSSRRLRNNANFVYITDAIYMFIQITHECMDSKRLIM